MSNDPLSNLPRRAAARKRAGDAVKSHYVALKRLGESLFAKAKEQEDPGVMSMYAADSRDIFRIARMVKDGDFRAAYQAARNMDTAARENIPTATFNFLYDNR